MEQLTVEALARALYITVEADQSKLFPRALRFPGAKEWDTEKAKPEDMAECRMVAAALIETIADPQLQPRDWGQ